MPENPAEEPTAASAAPNPEAVPDAVGQPETPVKDRKVPGEYGASAITVLEGLEAVRKRPGMYIGSTDSRGLMHCLWEIIDNSVDEALAGFGQSIEITLHPDGSVEVEDNGRGIPVDVEPRTGLSGVEVVFTKLHAGGKFGGGGYAVSGGLHGVGISVVNALSRRVDTEVRRQGHVWRMSFADGGVPQGELVKGEATDATGTVQTFYPDPEIFDSIEFDYETLRARFQQMAFLNKGLRITLTDERVQESNEVVDDEIAGEGAAGEDVAENGLAEDAEQEPQRRSVTYLYENGLLDYVQHLNSAKKVEYVHDDVIAFEAEDVSDGRSMAVEVAMQWTSAY